MALSPLAVMLLAQLGFVMLAVIIFQKLQKRRLIKELAGFKAVKPTFFAEQDSYSEAGFDREQAELLLNRIYQNTQTIISEAPAAKNLCLDQQALLHTLAECIDIPLEQGTGKPAAQATAKESDDLISQQEIDSALSKEEAIEEFDLAGFDDLDSSDDEFDLDDFENLETSDDAFDDDEELPEDTLQAAIDRMGDLDLSELEDQLQKIDD